MAQLAICPQCERELLIPEAMDAAEWVKCPHCREFLEVGKAPVRELPVAMPVEEALPDSLTPSTLDDISNLDTWKAPQREPEAATDEELVSDSMSIASAPAETPDETAERIDAWFRSAKTVVDFRDKPDTTRTEPVGADSSANDSYPEDFGAEPADMNDSTATVDISAVGFGGDVEDADFEFDAPTVAPDEDAAAWDDSEHMDNLLAEAENEPAAEFTMSDEASEAAEEEEQTDADQDWSAKVTASSLLNARKTRRPRSLVRTLIGTTLGGLVGLAIAYFALLWLRGPDLDFLQVAQYLPKSILPASFSQKSRTLVAAAPVQPAVEPAMPDATADETANATEETPAATEQTATPGEQPTDAAAAPADATAAPADATTDEESVATTETEPAAGTGERPASFNEPVATPPASQSDDNRYGEKSEASATPATEPAPLDAAPASPIVTESPFAPPAAEPIRIANAPTFAADDVKAALQVANEAQPKLVAGNLADSKDVARAKGFGYSMLADLAQKVTFVDAVAAADVLQQADELFKKTLSDAHTRSELAQIVPRWIAAATRKHGGIFLAGSISGAEAKGSVTEASVDLGTGQPLKVLLPPALAEQLATASQPLGIVGWLVDRPADQVAGYAGDAPQAIFVSRLIPLQ
jgi:hypothetical protein